MCVFILFPFLQNGLRSEQEAVCEVVMCDGWW